MDIIRLTTDADGVVTICIDLPGKKVNSITNQLIVELAEAVSAVEKQQPPPKAVIFASGKKDSFIARADLFQIRAMAADADPVTRFLRYGRNLFNRTAAPPVPTVAALNCS